MLFVVLRAGGDHFLVDAKQIVEILPIVQTTRLLNSPPHTTGVFNYHGSPVPLVDLTQAIYAIPSKITMGARIILSGIPTEVGQKRYVGWLAEEVIETVRLDEENFKGTHVAIQKAAHPSQESRTFNTLQSIDLNSLLPAATQDRLFDISQPQADHVR